MGGNLIIMGLFARATESLGRVFQPLVVFGQVPLFFYVTHLYLYGILGRLLTPDGTSIPRMYPFWLLGLLILYPLCQWYGRLKTPPAGPFDRAFLLSCSMARSRHSLGENTPYISVILRSGFCDEESPIHGGDSSAPWSLS